MGGLLREYGPIREIATHFSCNSSHFLENKLYSSCKSSSEDDHFGGVDRNGPFLSSANAY